MSRPLYDALMALSARDAARFHMPGHKGAAILPGWEAVTGLDLTELRETGDLYTPTPDSPIAKAETLLAGAYGAREALFLTGGATQGILSVLSAMTRPGDTVILDRNCHRSVHNALALLDLDPVWIYSPTIRPFDITAPVPAESVREALVARPESALVLVTCPTYYGVLSDLDAIAGVCGAAGVPLAVDAAHGAHLPFLPRLNGAEESDEAARVFTGYRSAQAVVMSAHKTLPALGQAAFVLLNCDKPPAESVRGFCALYGSSSPSYAVMASLDAARAHMERSNHLTLVTAWAKRLREEFSHLLRGPVDPTRLCLYTGDGYADALWLDEQRGVVCEMADDRNVLFILSERDGQDSLDRLTGALTALFSRKLVPFPGQSVDRQKAFPEAVSARSPRDALFGPQARRPLAQCEGKVSAGLVAPYPPGVPLLARGERITVEHIRALRKRGYGDTELMVCV